MTLFILRDLLRKISSKDNKLFDNLWQFFAYEQRIHIKRINQVGGYKKVRNC